MALRPNVVLIGIMGSGKTTVGKIVARRLGFQLLDTDHLLVQREGRPISQIFAEEGEPHFRELEAQVLRSIVHLERCVIATGGGTALREENRALLRELGFVVWLTASEEVLFERVSRNDKRPLLQTENPRETLRRLLAEREAIYRETAHFTLDASDLPLPEAAESIIAEARQAFSWDRVA